MSREELKLKIEEVERKLDDRYQKFMHSVRVIKVMIEEEKFFPDIINQEIDALESLINQKL